MYILDTTLREGEQTPGVAFPPHIKLRIAELLDRVSVDTIEVGHPVVSDNIKLALEEISARGLDATIAAHARSVREDVELALECGAHFIGIFYCVAQDRLDGVFQSSLSSAISKIQDVISFAKGENPDLIIRYTPEDTVRSRYSNVIEAARAAVEAGADIISIADTTGYMMPHVRSMYDYVSRLKEDLASAGLTPKIAVHCHNDRGFALANALDGVRGGAEIVDVTTMGLGERAGIVDLAQLLTSLPHYVDTESRALLEKFDLTAIPELYSIVSQFTGIPISPTAPIVGENAFTHCAGVHTHAAAKDPTHYESLEPETYGRTRSFSLDHMSGISSLRAALDQLEIQCNDDIAARALIEVKKIGEGGRTVPLEELRMIISWLEHQQSEKNPPLQTNLMTEPNALTNDRREYGNAC